MPNPTAGAVTGWIFRRGFRLFLAQCDVIYVGTVNWNRNRNNLFSNQHGHTVKLMRYDIDNSTCVLCTGGGSYS